jgi:DNA-binding transcriptional ArsR family regulator
LIKRNHLTFILVFAKLENMESPIDNQKMQQNAPKAAKLLKSLANEARLMILCQLAKGEQCVGDLWQHSSLSQSAFSQHLAKLRKENLVEVRKEAQTVFYKLKEGPALHVMQALHHIYCGDDH